MGLALVNIFKTINVCCPILWASVFPVRTHGHSLEAHFSLSEMAQVPVPPQPPAPPAPQPQQAQQPQRVQQPQPQAANLEVNIHYLFS